MSELAVLLKSMDTAIWELSEAFHDFPEQDLWKRPHPKLLSVGEIGTQIAFGEAQFFFGSDLDSPLNTRSAWYYTVNSENPFTLPLSSSKIYAEIKRIHKACKELLKTKTPRPDDPNPNREGWNWYSTLEYQGFHIAYHTGQIYMVRHLLGHTVKDN